MKRPRPDPAALERARPDGLIKHGDLLIEVEWHTEAGVRIPYVRRIVFPGGYELTQTQPELQVPLPAVRSSADFGGASAVTFGGERPGSKR